MGTNTEMFYLAYPLYVDLKKYIYVGHQGIQKGKIINGLIFPGKVKEHLNKAKKAMELLDIFTSK